MNGAPLSDDAWAILRAPIADIQIRDPGGMERIRAIGRTFRWRA